MKKASTLSTENRHFNYADRSSEDESQCASTSCLHVDINLKKSKLSYSLEISMRRTKIYPHNWSLAAECNSFLP